MNTTISNGTSALLAYQRSINVSSNNTANVNTTAFKADSVSFSDMMYGNGQVGFGVSMDAPTKNFDQGQLQPTDSEYDFSIIGDGFFTVASPLNQDVQYYTRAGHFKNDVNNMLVDQNDMLVLGNIPTVSGDKITSEYTNYMASGIFENSTSIESINTYTTNYKDTAIQTGTTGQNYKTAASNINDIEALNFAYQTALTSYSRDMNAGEPVSYHQDTISFSTEVNGKDTYSLEVKIDGIKFQTDYDKSVEKTLNNLSDKINQYTGITSSVDTSTGIMTIDSLIPGQKVTVSQAKVNGIGVLTETTSVEAGSGKQLVDALYTDMSNLLTSNGAKIATNSSTITKAPNGKAPVSSAISLDLNNLGMSDDSFATLENDNGNLYMMQGDAKFLVGKLETSTFSNTTALRPEGENLYSKTQESGDPMYVADSNEVKNYYLEASTVDLSKELVNLLNYQKAYEANSKSITTSDEMMKTALALKTK